MHHARKIDLQFRRIVPRHRWKKQAFASTRLGYSAQLGGPSSSIRHLSPPPSYSPKLSILLQKFRDTDRSSVLTPWHHSSESSSSFSPAYQQAHSLHTSTTPLHQRPTPSHPTHINTLSSIHPFPAATRPMQQPTTQRLSPQSPGAQVVLMSLDSRVTISRTNTTNKAGARRILPLRRLVTD